eukprot:TRINITY_DN1778_c0_g2_i1.p2 TRINITY_DN1778_c0_g2~~TRINITY_DN1778_c0_g2_i1.p2  ORF type:complete len:107 (+),score=0.05 TRINITY_DN1778_c0_g2_i1:344-664(+)
MRNSNRPPTPSILRRHSSSLEPERGRQGGKKLRWADQVVSTEQRQYLHVERLVPWWNRRSPGFRPRSPCQHYFQSIQRERCAFLSFVVPLLLLGFVVASYLIYVLS